MDEDQLIRTNKLSMWPKTRSFQIRFDRVTTCPINCLDIRADPEQTLQAHIQPETTSDIKSTSPLFGVRACIIL